MFTLSLKKCSSKLFLLISSSFMVSIIISLSEWLCLNFISMGSFSLLKSGPSFSLLVVYHWLLSRFNSSHFPQERKKSSHKPCSQRHSWSYHPNLCAIFYITIWNQFLSPIYIINTTIVNIFTSKSYIIS